MTTPTRSLALLLLALPLLAAGSGCIAEGEEGTPDGELLFGLDDEDVQQIHADYLADEDLEQVRAKLTAPFDCSLFDDMCKQVGREAAIEITGRQVEQMLAGESAEQIQAELDLAIPAASEARRESDALLANGEPEVSFRVSTDWAIRTKGDYRLRVRNGLTTPLSGKRRAWTESDLQHHDLLGWWGTSGTEVCANTGNNTQIERWASFVPPLEFVLEDKDPAKDCQTGANSFEQETFHERNTWVPGWEVYYDITVRGCGSALVNGFTLGICADDLELTF